MVSKKSIYYGGFGDFRSPVVPKAPRSLRRRSHTKSLEGSKICAFELLAAVADQLLQESESSTSSAGLEQKEQISVPKEFVKCEQPEVKLERVRSDLVDQGSCDESESLTVTTNLKCKLEPPLKEPLQSENNSGLEHVSDVTTSGFLKKVGTNVKLEPSEGKNVDKLEGGAPNLGDLCDLNLVNNIADIQKEAIEKQSGDLTFRDPVESCIDTRMINESYTRVHLPFYKDHVPCFTRHRGSVKMGIRDDDENSFRDNHRSTKMRAFRSQSRAGYRKIRKMLTSRYQKAAPKRDYELTNTTSGGAKPFYQNRKNLHMREWHQAEAASKRRKLFHRSSNTSYIQEANREGISKSCGKSDNRDKTSPHASSNKVISHKGSFQCKDSHVKFSIKSFKVPELYLEMPETETVGSLKRTVMEAVSAILGGELHVGILLEGKKVRDNNRTLQQTGISQNSDLETLGFTLEPSFPQAISSPIQKEPPLLLPSDTNQHLSRSAASPITDVGFYHSSLDPPAATRLDNQFDKNEEIIPVQTEVLAEERVADSKALVSVPGAKAEALSVFPVSHKPNKKSDVSQRRTRRPFSVTEVEALVEAVETLGTGRWRDVKMRAFDDANHRTYVDLKDKWKTLVHTASISPQQRRGEPVPQDLLDRVLAAHAYWSQHQLQQQRKHHREPLGISDGSNVNFVGI